MRVLEVVDFVYPRVDAGDGYAALAECRYLARDGFQVQVVSITSSQGNCPFDSRANTVVHGVSVDIVSESDGLSALTACPDIVVLHQPTGFHYAYRVSTHFGIPLVYRMHIDYRELFDLAIRLELPVSCCITRGDPKSLLELEEQTLQNSAAVVLPSNYMQLRRTYPCQTYVVPPRMLPLAANPDKPLQRRRQPTVVLGGRLDDPMKGLSRMVQALAHLREVVQAVKVLVIGTLPDEDAFALRQIFCDSVKFESWVSNREQLADCLLQGDLFLSMSHYEPYGLMITEAISLGLLPVCSDVGVAYDFLLPMNENLIVSNALPPRQILEAASSIMAYHLDNIEHLVHTVLDVQSAHRAYIERLLRMDVVLTTVGENAL